MIEELFDLLAYPDEYECCWHDGEIYLRKCTEQTVTIDAKQREVLKDRIETDPFTPSMAG